MNNETYGLTPEEVLNVKKLLANQAKFLYTIDDIDKMRELESESLKQFMKENNITDENEVEKTGIINYNDINYMFKRKSKSPDQIPKWEGTCGGVGGGGVIPSNNIDSARWLFEALFKRF